MNLFSKVWSQLWRQADIHYLVFIAENGSKHESWMLWAINIPLNLCQVVSTCGFIFVLYSSFLVLCPRRLTSVYYSNRIPCLIGLGQWEPWQESELGVFNPLDSSLWVLGADWLWPQQRSMLLSKWLPLHGICLLGSSILSFLSFLWPRSSNGYMATSFFPCTWPISLPITPL